MPRPRQAQGRPGTPLVPSGWGRSHSVVVDRALASSLTIGPAGGTSGWDEGLGQTVTTPAAPVYNGPAAVMPAGQSGGADRDTTVVEEPVSTRVYEITVSRNRAGADLIDVGHVVTVTSCDDAALVGRRLRVDGFEQGTRRFSRVIRATLTTT